MVPVVEHDPADGVTEVRTPEDGMKAVRPTLVADEGPLFVTVTV
jgi:hypothetical protein